ncbi:Na+/H+-dicarboxylate symporter [Filimonas lacunae]|uniref:Na+/H+-dicarboxylate symporter n=1 Tax=Filimonas lacunae TaxID=477680 RepID=A0A173MF90_9BACT|nr:dicarboxylate/amino acid:cation symporter [Filimonas lacunae]BAV06272.1 sodium:dicarboxylate symporter [Filimonas lacunae]SIT25583.1 Na+/H+-dicarboxylate symporter [Filimonas lacunae]
MTETSGSFYKNYSSIIWLLAGIITGSVLGLTLGTKVVAVLKPLGDIFINLLFMAVIPLVFFAIGSAVAGVDTSQKLGKLFVIMMLVFMGTALVAAVFTLLGVYIYPVHQEMGQAANNLPDLNTHPDIGTQLTQLVTVSDFYELLSRKSMLPLIIFSLLTGFAALRAGDSGKAFRQFLVSGNEVMKQLLLFVMKLAPIGLGAYFAYQISTVGPELFTTYARSLGLFYVLVVLYYLLFFTLYAYIAGGKNSVRLYWKNNLLPSVTAVGTCSSVATIPANLDAAAGMQIPAPVRNIVVPLGATLHKEGSAISSMIKIAVVFAMFNKPLTGIDTITLALGISVVVSMVEGGIPNGGYIGELLVMSVYHFPPEALPAVMIIGTLVDPGATLLNVTGDTVSAMLVAKFMKTKTSEAA